METKIPIIKPIKLKEYHVKQSKYDMVARLPMRSIILSPSGGGKTILIQNIILDIHKNLFSRIYIFSPSIDVDLTWSPVKDYIDKVMNVKHTEEEPIYFSEYAPEQLQKIIDTQRNITEHQKKKETTKHLFQILIVIDDFADDPAFTRHSKLLHGLFTRGRHSQISTIVSTQRFFALHPIIRVNASELYVFRLRNFNDLQAFIDEVSALLDKQSLLHIYNMATEAPHSFLFCNLVAKQRNKIFMIRFEKRIEIE